MKEVLIKNEKEMIDFGKKIAAELKGGDILCLYGDLGAGKTTLTKGIAQVFGIKKRIKSPTFTILNLYQIQDNSKFKIQNSKFQVKNENLPMHLVHIDLYRLKTIEEFLEIGGDEYLGEENTICVIEWPKKIEGLLKNILQRRTGLGPEKCVKIRIEHTSNGRKIQY